VLCQVRGFSEKEGQHGLHRRRTFVRYIGISRLFMVARESSMR
jgi:hypothetical protein